MFFEKYCCPAGTYDPLLLRLICDKERHTLIDQISGHKFSVQLHRLENA